MELPSAREFTMMQLDNEMVEIALLLPHWQASALETAAHSRGVSTAQMVRNLIGRYFDSAPAQGFSMMPTSGTVVDF